MHPQLVVTAQLESAIKPLLPLQKFGAKLPLILCLKIHGRHDREEAARNTSPVSPAAALNRRCVHQAPRPEGQCRALRPRGKGNCFSFMKQNNVSRLKNDRIYR